MQFRYLFLIMYDSVLFNIYINKVIQKFKTVIKKGVNLNNRKLVNTYSHTTARRMVPAYTKCDVQLIKLLLMMD